MKHSIRSKTDVITNSSDEVYVYRSDRDPEEVYQEMMSILGPDHECSGMGGILDIANSTSLERMSYGGFEGLPEGYLVMDIDHGYYPDLEEYLKTNFGQALEGEEYKKEVRVPCQIESYRRNLRKITSGEVVVSKDDLESMIVIEDLLLSLMNLFDLDIEIERELPEAAFQEYLGWLEKELQETKNKFRKDSLEKNLEHWKNWYEVQYKKQDRGNN